MVLEAIMRMLMKLLISLAVLCYVIVQSYGPLVGLMGVVVDNIRYWIGVYVYVCLTLRRYYSVVLQIISIFRRPLAEELRRFVSVFRPEPVVWYNWVCLKRAVEFSVGNLFGSKRVPTSLDELSMFANHPLYVRQVCVLYITWLDVVFLMFLCLIFVLIGYICVRAVLTRLHFFDPIGRVNLSKYISWLISMTQQPLFLVATVRKTFSNMSLVALRVPSNHTHPKSAAVRTQSVSTIELICRSLGVNPYFVQLSPSDVKNRRVGCRTFYWGKDIGVTASEFLPPRDSVIAIIDVDMYLDMPFLLANHVHTYMISTFQPTCVASDEGEFSFTFDENDTVKYTVSGGAVYEHPVWNYAGDILTVSARVWFGLGVRTTVYNVDRKQCDRHHQIVCLTPMRTFISPLFDMSFMLGSPKLDRLRVYVEGFLRLKVKKVDCTMVSTAVVGRYAAATILMMEDDTLAGHARLGKTDITVAGVRQVLPEIDAEAASVLVQYHRRGLEYDSSTVFPVEESVNHYQFDPKSYDPAAAPGVVPFMSPFILGCFAPVKSRSNDEATVQGRVLDVKPDDNIEITPLDLSLMKEFTEFLVPDRLAGTGVPVGIEEVFERQNRPTQRRILDFGAMAYSLLAYIGMISCFQKAESYGDIKDPRNISQVPDTTKLNYSSYMYAFVDTVLKLQPWYAFAYTPIEIAARVVCVCSNALFAYNTDLSRFDGRVSKYLRTLESLYMQRWVRPDLRSELAELCASQHGQRATTRFGVKFDTGYSRLSGSPETSSFNSIDNAFMAYKALRGTRVNGEFMTPAEAWAALGIYGGDDGLTANVDPNSYVRACASVGQKLEISEIPRGGSGVSFLSRLYSPAVWFGSPNSMCDVARQLAKIHVTTSFPPEITAMQKLHEKMTGFYVSDYNTPIIGPLAQYVVEKLGPADLKLGVAGYFSYYPENSQFPNADDGDWMISEVEKALPLFDFGMFNSWLGKVKDGTASVLEPPLCVPTPTQVPKVKRDVVVNGDVIKAPVKPISTPVVTESTQDPVPALVQLTLVGERVPDVGNVKPTPVLKVVSVATTQKLNPVHVDAVGVVYQCPHIAAGCVHGLKCIHLLKNSPCKGPLCEFKHGQGVCKKGMGCDNIAKCKYLHRVESVKKKEVFVKGPCKRDLLCKNAKCGYQHSATRVLTDSSKSSQSPQSVATSDSSSLGSGVRA